MTQILQVDEARALVRIRCRPLPEVETVALADALGRFLAVEVASTTPWPTTDRSAMDGFAMATCGRGIRAGEEFPLRGAALAGHPFDGELAVGDAVRIMTGAVVPAGADVVVRVEDSSGFEGDVVTVNADVPPGDNIRPMGSEVAAGTRLLERGRRIHAAEIGALAVLGHAEVAVVRRPRVAILATGDEVVGVDREPAPHQVRDSNSWALAAKVLECGGIPTRLGIAADEEGPLREALRRGLEEHDLLVTIGGVSKGTHDLVHTTLAELGVGRVFHGVALKPGKPTFFGVREVAPTGGGAACHVLGLPGNPASACTTFDLFAVPLLHALVGAPEPVDVQVRPAGVPPRRNWRAQAIPGRLEVDADGVLRAVLAELRPSGDPFGLLEGDGYGLVAGDRDPGAEGSIGFVRYATGGSR